MERDEEAPPPETVQFEGEEFNVVEFDDDDGPPDSESEYETENEDDNNEEVLDEGVAGDEFMEDDATVRICSKTSCLLSKKQP
jgi:hypothetical protein